MFPYRRQGPKKRKNGQARNKMRGPQKGLPNSARDLLPILQPATKALAQVLAGRTQASGQLGHAQSVLAHAERLIAERAHNRLNPAEREEFFEQLARLRLTLADAAAEAEAQAADEQVVKPPARQVAQERLKEMALALTQPERPAAPAGATGANGGAGVADRATADAPPRPAETEVADAPDEPRAAPAPVQPGRPGRLQLPRASAEVAASAVATSGVGSAMRRRSRRAAAEAAAAAEAVANAAPPPQQDAAGEAPERSAEAQPPPVAQARPPFEDEAAADEGEKRNGRRARKLKNKGLPEGWVIDDEGFVVPGPN